MLSGRIIVISRMIIMLSERIIMLSGLIIMLRRIVIMLSGMNKCYAVYCLHTALLHWPLSSAATMEVQGPDTT